MSAKPDLEQTPTGDYLGQLVDMRSMKDHSLHGNEIVLVDTQDGVQLESERKTGSANKKDELSSLHQLLFEKDWLHCAYLHHIYPQQSLLRVCGLGQHNFFLASQHHEMDGFFSRERLFIMDDCAIREPLK